jgi:hypothetical protein
MIIMAQVEASGTADILVSSNEFVLEEILKPVICCPASPSVKVK